MKHKLLCALLAAEAALCVLLSLLKISLNGLFSSAIAFPFEQIGLLLRRLSLAGRLGSSAALALYAAICLAPVWLLLRAKARRGLHWEDSLLALLSTLLLAVLYLMVNTGYISDLFLASGQGMRPIAFAMLGGTIWSVAFSYLVLRVLRLFFCSGSEKLWDYLRILLGLMAAVFVAALGVSLSQALSSLSALMDGNTGGLSAPVANYAFWLLGFLVGALPYVLNIGAVFLGLGMLDRMQADRYSQETARAANRLALWCKRSLAAVVVSNVGFNILQLLFASRLHTVTGSVSLPVTSIFFVLAVLLFARLTDENRRLKQDNDLFI